MVILVIAAQIQPSGSTVLGVCRDKAFSGRSSGTGVTTMGQTPLQLNIRVSLHRKKVPRQTEPREMTSRGH